MGGTRVCGDGSVDRHGDSRCAREGGAWSVTASSTPVELKSVRLPEYQIRLLETLSQHAGVTVEEYVYASLLSLEVVASPDAIERSLPGFREALTFPYGQNEEDV